MPISLPRMCPVLVERDAEVAALDALLEEAAAGQGRLAVLTGEAGAGKSRLVREVERLAAARGFQRLEGGCRERDRDYPFAPVVDALRQRLVASPEDVDQILGPQRAALAELLPELRTDGAADRTGIPPEHGKRRLFEAIAALLAFHAARQPLLLVLEDLHWADPTSLELLEVLPRRLGHARLLILVTARPGEPNQDLRRCLEALRRARDVVELSVNPLAEAGVRRMLEALLDPVPSPALVSSVFALTAGNPFFVEELLAVTPDAAKKPWLLQETAVPDSVQQTILRRTAGLSDSARRVLDLASVIGQRTSFELLLAASGLGRTDVLSALRVLIEERFLAEERAPGRVRLVFRHALTREALLGRLLAPERQALHRVVGEALERDGADGNRTAEVLSELGYHFHAAGAWGRALAYAAQAGAAARRVQATVEALNHDRRALDAALALDDSRSAELHRRCGQGIALLGDFDAARAHLVAARALATRFALADVEQAALYDLSGLYASRDYTAARSFAEEALSLARANGDRHREALALNRLGNVLTNLRRFDEGRALHEDALRAFQAVDESWGIADSWDLIGMARYLAGEAPEAWQAFGEAAALFADLGDTERRASALTSRGLYLAALDGACATDASPAAYRADADLGLRLCRQIAWRAGEAYALVAMASASLGEGRFEEAQQYGEAALAIAAEIGHDQWQVMSLLTLGILDAAMLDPAGALGRFERARGIAATAGAEQWVERLDAWIACCRVRTGELGEPLVDALGESAPPPPPASIGQRRALIAFTERELGAGRPDRALAAADRLLLGAAGPRPAEAVLLRGMALAALDRVAEADAAFHDARRLAAEFGPRMASWNVAAQRAALWRTRDPKIAGEEVAIGRMAVMALAETISGDERRAAFLQAPGLRSLVAPAGRRRTSDAAGPGGLTPREREVAMRVAQGLSNKEIARDLGIAEKTVEMHVGSGLAKLGFTSRAQIAAWAVAERLVVPAEPLG